MSGITIFNNYPRRLARAAMRLLAIGFFSAITILGLSGRAQACFQESVPSVSIRSNGIAGKITVNGKPLVHATLNLRKLPYKFNRKQEPALGTAITSEDGTFSFGEMASGKYVMVMVSPSGESTNVEVLQPKPGESDTILINFFVDFCQEASVVSWNGSVLKHSAPPILGAAKTGSLKR